MPPEFDQWYGKAITGFLRATTNLRTFSINLLAWEDSDLEHLARIPTPPRTCVCLPSPDCPWLTCVASPGGPFPTLVDLTLDVLSLEHTALFFLVWGVPAACRLQRLAMKATQCPSPFMVPAFFAVLTMHCSLSTLTAFSLSDRSEVTEAAPDRPSCTITTDGLFPLTVFVGLRSLVLDGAGLTTLLPSRPALEQLSIGAGHGRAASWNAPLAFAGLARIIGAAPKLESLYVAREFPLSTSLFAKFSPALLATIAPLLPLTSSRTIFTA